MTGKSGAEKTSTRVYNFHEQMRYLKEAGFTVALLPDLIESGLIKTEHQ
ncbi:hypothetical protein ACFLU8_05150 [Chloroflexota bacterium]